LRTVTAGVRTVTADLRTGTAGVRTVTADVRTVTADGAQSGPAGCLSIPVKSLGYGLGVPRPLPRGAGYSWGHRHEKSR
jgi:hypothetical protein